MRKSNEEEYMGVEPNKSYNYDDIIQKNAAAEEYPYDNYGYYEQMKYSDEPLDENGEPIRNRFGLKLTISIILLIVALPLGILPLIFTLQQNSSYTRGDWEAFRRNRRRANVFLWLSGILEVLIIAAIAALVILVMKQDGVLLDMQRVIYGLEDDARELSWNWSDDEAEQADDSWEYTEIEEVPGMYSLKLADAELSLPSTLSDFLDVTGVEFDEDFSECSLDSYESMEFTSTDGNLSITIINYSENWQQAMDCTLESLEIDFFEGETFDFTYMDTLGPDSTKEDFEAIFGEACWYFESDNWENCSWYTNDGTLDISFEDGKMTDFLLSHYGDD